MGSAHAMFISFRNSYRVSYRVAKIRIAAIVVAIYLIWDMKKIFLTQCVEANDIHRKIQILSYRLFL